MSNPDVTASFAAVLADEWVRAGVTHAVVAPAFGWPIFCSTMSAISSVIAHMPLPICALPRRPARRPTSTLESS